MSRLSLSLTMSKTAAFCLAFSSALGAQQKFQVATQPVTQTLASAASQLDAQSSVSQISNHIPSQLDAPLVADRLIRAFQDRTRLDRVHLVEQIDASPAIDSPLALSIFQDALRDEDPLVKEAALRALMRRDSPEHPVLFESDLPGFHGQVADLARVHLASLHEDTSTLRELARNGDAVVQECAFDALATRDLSSALEVLQTELRDPHSLHRLQTLQLMVRSAWTNSPDRIEPILRQAAQDHDPLLRDYAVGLLAKAK